MNVFTVTWHIVLHGMFGFIHNWLNKWVPVNEWTARMRTENAKSLFNLFLNDFTEQLKRSFCLWMKGIQVGQRIHGTNYYGTSLSESAVGSRANTS